jgi:hypothetical protein
VAQRQQQARAALEARILRGEPIRPALSALRAAGLEPDVEIADIRRSIMAFGRQVAGFEGDYLPPEQLFELGREAMATGLSESSPAAPAVGPVPSAPAVPVDPSALERLRGVMPGPVGSRQSVPLRPRFRYTPDGLVPVQ